MWPRFVVRSLHASDLSLNSGSKIHFEYNTVQDSDRMEWIGGKESERNEKWVIPVYIPIRIHIWIRTGVILYILMKCFQLLFSKE